MCLRTEHLLMQDTIKIQDGSLLMVPYKCHKSFDFPQHTGSTNVIVYVDLLREPYIIPHYGFWGC